MARRIRRTPAQWQAHIEAWHASGLSQAAYCRKYDLNDKLFSLRKRQLKGKLGSLEVERRVSASSGH